MAPPILTRLQGRFPVFAHDHIAVLYREREAAFGLASFLAEGLERGDLCHCLAPEDFQTEMLERMRAAGTDPGRYAKTLRLHKGLPDFAALCDQTRQVFEDAEHAHVPAVRWLEEGSWAEPVGFPMPQFFEFHAVLNYQVKHYPSVALCQYSIQRYEPHHLFSAIATHRHLLVGDTLVRDNPFYIPAEKFIPLSAEERQRDLTRAFREVEFNVEKLLVAIAGYGRIYPELYPSG